MNKNSKMYLRHKLSEEVEFDDDINLDDLNIDMSGVDAAEEIQQQHLEDASVAKNEITEYDFIKARVEKVINKYAKPNNGVSIVYDESVGKYSIGIKGMFVVDDTYANWMFYVFEDISSIRIDGCLYITIVHNNVEYMRRLQRFLSHLGELFKLDADSFIVFDTTGGGFIDKHSFEGYPIIYVTDNNIDLSEFPISSDNENFVLFMYHRINKIIEYIESDEVGGEVYKRVSSALNQKKITSRDIICKRDSNGNFIKKFDFPGECELKGNKIYILPTIDDINYSKIIKMLFFTGAKSNILNVGLGLHIVEFKLDK